MKTNYENDIRIDENALDVELLQQATLTFKYSRLVAELSFELSKKKEELDVVKAELDKDIRNNPDDYEINKITESVVLSVILTNKKYLKANKDYLEARYEHEVAQAAVRALNDKKSSLENLVKLHGQQYFAGPSLPRDIGGEWMKKQADKRTQETIGGTFKRNK